MAASSTKTATEFRSAFLSSQHCNPQVRASLLLTRTLLLRAYSEWKYSPKISLKALVEEWTKQGFTEPPASNTSDLNLTTRFFHLNLPLELTSGSISSSSAATASNPVRPSTASLAQPAIVISNAKHSSLTRTPAQVNERKQLPVANRSEPPKTAPPIDPEMLRRRASLLQSPVKQHEDITADVSRFIHSYVNEGAITAKSTVQVNSRMARVSLLDGNNASLLEQVSLLGTLRTSPTAANSLNDQGSRLFLNVHHPFCFVAVGVQGSGKSHTVGVLLENCMMTAAQLGSCPSPAAASATPVCDLGITTLREPMSALVFHYDQGCNTICEAAGLGTPSPDMLSFISDKIRGTASSVSLPRVEDIVVLVSPSCYRQRKRAYAEKVGSHCVVLPLLFSPQTLTAKHICQMMHLTEGSNQLYKAVMLTELRSIQRQDTPLNFSQMMDSVIANCPFDTQKDALRQRKDVFEEFMADCEKNAEYKDAFGNLELFAKKGRMIIADLSDPMLSPDEANGLFHVLFEQFRSIQGLTGKVVVFDEAHKYMKEGDCSGTLCSAICESVRLLRHEATRVVISTQNPKALTSELLELANIVLIHRFHSQEWFNYLKTKISLEDGLLSEIQELGDGESLVFANRSAVQGYKQSASVIPCTVRRRLTKDRGASVVHQEVN
ncbi:conserved mitochondrial AAA_10 domain-containing protein [Andalucia godoyi]|uniref:Conserved mitochondrial AAA_10 domain-containing protein n=1 Tax=Andalucia godoyi TaxID=505711 RepID=A0A8K0AG74_ANDGO|nr:conserved mitochondrial AAA_10 domain-containing protein [Andalucia godoyi]|eukprot:ANDGO_01855.mRNA.1 conserved mitochondrial AAA_10 domain-containing protein